MERSRLHPDLAPKGIHVGGRYRIPAAVPGVGVRAQRTDDSQSAEHARAGIADAQNANELEAADQERYQSPIDVSSTESMQPVTLRTGVAVICRYRACKKVTKKAEQADLVPCSNEGCVYSVHDACLSHLRGDFAVETTVAAPFCSKRCFNAIKKLMNSKSSANTSVKRRVPWGSDGITESISSINCLLDWLTTGGNYNRYRGGDAQTGETKKRIAGEIVRFISDCGITTPRCAKDVVSKISSLESSFKVATDWLANTGQGLLDDETSLRKAILDRCKYYDELYPIMVDRPSTTPLALSTDRLSDDSMTEDTDTDATSYNTGRKRASSAPTSVAPKRLRPARKSNAGEDAYQLALLELKESQLNQDGELHKHTIAYKNSKVAMEQSKVDLLVQQTRTEAAESQARIQEAHAKAFRMREEAQLFLLQRKVTLLRERKKLLDEGIVEQEIDLLLPLTTEL